MQMIFQDPISSLNPRRKVEDIVAEGLAIWKHRRPRTRSRSKVDEVLETVGLDPDAAPATAGRTSSPAASASASRSPARVVTEPKLIICDEPVSALDVSVQAQILNLLEDMKARYGLTLIFIAHDLAVVKNVSDRVVGHVPRQDLRGRRARRRSTTQPAHPYTAALLAAIPVPGPVGQRPRSAPRVGGEIPSPLAPPSGCRFRTRCPKAQERLRGRGTRRSARSGPSHFVACHFPLNPGETLPTGNGAQASATAHSRGSPSPSPVARVVGRWAARVSCPRCSPRVRVRAGVPRLRGVSRRDAGPHAQEPLAIARYPGRRAPGPGRAPLRYRRVRRRRRPR